MRSTVIWTLAALASAPATMLPAEAGRTCPARTSMAFGETAESLAHRCRITVEALERQNPGFDRNRPQVGVGINVPAPPLPSPQFGIHGNRSIVAPPPRIDIPRL